MTSMTILPERWKAFSVITPSSGLPAASRTSGASMPWSAALRIRCVNGSPSNSSMLLSISVSSPCISRRICFAGGLRNVVDRARVSLEECSHGQHANAHHPLMQLAGIALHRRHCLAQLGQARGLKVLDHLRGHHVRNHQFAHQIDQPVHLVDGHADRTRLAARRGLRRGLAPIRNGRLAAIRDRSLAAFDKCGLRPPTRAVQRFSLRPLRLAANAESSCGGASERVMRISARCSTNSKTSRSSSLRATLASSTVQLR